MNIDKIPINRELKLVSNHLYRQVKVYETRLINNTEYLLVYDPLLVKAICHGDAFKVYPIYSDTVKGLKITSRVYQGRRYYVDKELYYALCYFCLESSQDEFRKIISCLQIWTYSFAGLILNPMDSYLQKFIAYLHTNPTYTKDLVTEYLISML